MRGQTTKEQKGIVNERRMEIILCSGGETWKDVGAGEEGGWRKKKKHYETRVARSALGYKVCVSEIGWPWSFVREKKPCILYIPYIIYIHCDCSVHFINRMKHFIFIIISRLLIFFFFPLEFTLYEMSNLLMIIIYIVCI